MPSNGKTTVPNLPSHSMSNQSSTESVRSITKALCSPAGFGKKKAKSGNRRNLMHYIEYIPGTIARITDKPTRHGHEDVNLLSRYVVEFNEFNSVYYTKLS